MNIVFNLEVEVKSILLSSINKTSYAYSCAL